MSQQVNVTQQRLSQRLYKTLDAVGAFIEYWGFKSIHGRIWTLLALRRVPMSQVEIAEVLGVSRSLVSMAIAELEKYSLVQTTDTHRNAPYEAVMDVWPTISDVLRNREWQLLETARAALEAAVEEGEVALAADEPVPFDVSRARRLLVMAELAQALLKMLLSLRVPRIMGDFDDWIQRAAGFIRGLHGDDTP